MRQVAAAVVLATLSLALPSTREARVIPSTREARVPFAPGESLTYDVSWSSYLTAGEATATVRDKRPGSGSANYYIVAEGRPVGVLTYLLSAYYKADTLLGAAALAPERASIFIQENRRQQYKVSQFDQAKHTVAYEVTGRGASPKQTVRVLPNTQDFLSALYVIRTMTLKQGAKAQMTAFDSGDVFRVQLTGGAVESIQTGVGAMNAQRIAIDASTDKGERVGQNLAVWLSTDARRLPVMLNADLPVGSFRLTLRGVK